MKKTVLRKYAQLIAQAGVNVATGGSRHLQNYQTEQGIDTMEDNLDKVRDSIKDMESQISELGDKETQLSQAVTGAKAQADAATQALAQEQVKLDNLNAELKAIQNPGKDENDVDIPVDTAAEAAKKVEIQAQELEVARAKLAATTADGKLSDAQSGLSQVQSGKSQLESALESTKSQKETLKDNLKTTEKTYEITKNEVYPQTDATYSAQLAQANVALESAQYQLDMYTVKAPISGQIESISVEKDSMASAGSPAYVISNKDSMTVTFNVAEKAKNELQVGDAIEVERNGETFAGTITEVGTMAGPQTRLFQVKASVIGSGDKLPSGVSVKVHATTQREESSLVIPYDAIYFSAGSAYVYCVEDGKLVKTPITVGLMNDNEAVVADGLNGESQVVTTWSSKLRDGAEVVVKTEAEDAE